MSLEYNNKSYTLRINKDLLELAKEKKLNIRKLVNDALRSELENQKCPTCGLKMKRVKNANI
jgi:post-segregation antitoxin (ccd killing protein)